jgi:carbamoyltransferase
MIQKDLQRLSTTTRELQKFSLAVGGVFLLLGGWLHGLMEFGLRALGSRSVIGDARSEWMQSQMNLRIKFRESFRPFAPSVLAEDVSTYFELDRESPYMLLVAPVRKELRCELTEEQQRAMKAPDLRKRVNVKRSTIPAVTHVDMSARIQSVDEERHGRYYRLIREFKRQTGCGVIINTSFNIRGEPTVCTPQDASRCFLVSDMDVLVLENYILYKTEQPEVSKAEREKYIGSFSLD